MPSMFSVEQRDRVRDHVLEMGASDDRVVAGAVVGGLADGGGDRWSDLDLTFGVAESVSVDEVLADWTVDLVRSFDAVHLFDLPSDAAIYRVFLLPGCLQVDLSFAPAPDFGARGPKFTLLFGNAVERPYVPQPSPHDLFGLAEHHAVRARFCIERGRSWQAEHWIAGIRDNALSLACRRRGLDARHGRSFDDLPADVLDAFGASLVRSMERRISCARSMPRSASCCVTRPRLPTSLRKLNLGSAN
jgi:hypothetical protein